MNKQYRELFQVIARNGALNAENALKVINTEERPEDVKLLIEMRDRYGVLEDKIMAGKEELEITDYIQLYAGAVVSKEIIQKNINTWSTIVKEYEDNLIPKLHDVATAKSNEEKEALIEQFFS